MAWTTLSFSYGATLTSTQMNQLYANFAAMAAGDSGSPTITATAFVGQSQLKTTISEVSSAVTTNTLLPGGTYGFYPQTKVSIGSTVSMYILNSATEPLTYGTYIGFNISAGTGYAQQRYVQASPPYDLGDGEIGQFIFAVVDNATGKIETVYAAPEAPWHLNGPTDTRADYYDKDRRGWRKQPVTNTTWTTDPITGLAVPRVEVVSYETIEITQAIKQADMPRIPHPFQNNALTGKTVVLLDPVSDFTWHLAHLREQGESVNELLHSDYLRIDNIALTRAGPPGVMVVPVKWRSAA